MDKDTIIRVENLGKRYTLGAQASRSNTTFRELVTNSAQSLLRRRSQVEKAEAASTDFWALKDVSFEVKRGEVVGIIGRNGAGKSTLLKVLSRITEPTQGSISLKGRVASLLEVGTGFHPELTGRENIFLNGAILGMHRTEIKAKFDEIVAFAEVERFLDTPVKRYSSGMYVRLAFAVAAHLEPEILIVDEVLAVGDVEFQKKCLGKMSEVAGGGRTVLFVSHNMAAVHQLCTRALLLDRGTLVQSGKPLEIIDTYLHTAAESGFTGGQRLEDTLWIADAKTLDATGEASSQFTHREAVQLVIDIHVAQAVAGAVVGIVLKDGKDRAVFYSEDALPSPAQQSSCRYEATIPGQLLAPGRYVLTLFLHVPIVRMIFLANDALVVNIIDAGSPLAIYEGKGDYGCVLVDCQWRMTPLPAAAVPS